MVSRSRKRIAIFFYFDIFPPSFCFSPVILLVFGGAVHLHFLKPSSFIFVVPLVFWIGNSSRLPTKC